MVIRQALAAGVVGGILIDAYLWITTILPSHGSIVAMYQWVASAAIGPIAMTNTSFAWLGLLVHFVVSIGWAGGYAYFAQTQSFVNTRWLVSGLCYGIVVLMFMSLVLIGAHAFTFPSSPNEFINSLIAHCVFYGLPVAFVVARMSKQTAQA
jgi:uncharacterized membrane protein YagU involved in acid resistance